MSVWIRSLEEAREHIPPMQVLLLVFSPFPQVVLHSEYDPHVEYTETFFLYFVNEWISIFLKFSYLVVFRYNSEMIIRRLLLWIEYMHVALRNLFDQSSHLYKDRFQYQYLSQSRTVQNFSEHCWWWFPWYRPEFKYINNKPRILSVIIMTTWTILKKKVYNHFIFNVYDPYILNF